MKIENQELRLSKRDVSNIASHIKKATELGHAKVLDVIAGALSIKGGNALMSMLKSSGAPVESEPPSAPADEVEVEGGDYRVSIEQALSNPPASRILLIKSPSQPSIGRAVESIARQRNADFIRHSARFHMEPAFMAGFMRRQKPAILFIDDIDYAQADFIESIEFTASRSSKATPGSCLVLASAIDFPASSPRPEAARILKHARLLTILSATLPQMPHQDLLSEREKYVLAQIAYGNSVIEVAHKAGISTRTVETHLFNVREKLNTPNNTGAATRAALMGLIKLDPSGFQTR